jgi:peptidoglycan/xylan/chitin deacetylase (PgdA/CDA1 family)
MTMLGAAIALLVALGIAAVVMAATGTTARRPAPQARVRPAGARTDAATGRGRMRRTRNKAPVARAGAVSAADRRQSRAISAVLRYTPFIAAGTRRRRVMALSFDDGPSPYTPAVVRVLARMHVPATFFVVGQQLTYFFRGLQDELKHGFQVGDHTQNHAWLPSLNAAQQCAQIRDGSSAVTRFGALAPRLFRPPYGAYNDRTLSCLRRLKMLMVLWSIDPGDWRRPGVRAIVSNVLANSRPGAIVIMHDGGGDRSQTVAALPAVIRGLRHRGYQLVSVAQLIQLDPPPRRQRLPPLGGA